MGRKKTRPIRSGGLMVEADVVSSSNLPSSSSKSSSQDLDDGKDEGLADSGETVYIDVDRSNWDSVDHFDIGEVILNDVKFSDSKFSNWSVEDCFRGSNFQIRFCLKDVKEGSFRLGQWPILSATDSVFLEYLLLSDCKLDSNEPGEVIFSGIFDGPDESVSGLVHLVNLKFISLRPTLSFGDSVENRSFKLRVEILRNAFDACESLLETIRQPWRKSLVHVMSWLRPEVTTSEAIWGMDCDLQPQETNSHGQDKLSQFDAATFYEAIKPSREEPMIDEDLPCLLPTLRPYQRRAAFWMVQREKGAMKAPGDNMTNHSSVPYSVAVVFLDKNANMYYNPFNGNISLLPGPSFSYVAGGILADEMGLGKTVELLACISTHRRPSLEHDFMLDGGTEDIRNQIKRKKLERVECICGAASESSKYTGLWVQCDVCDAWQHGDCVGYSTKKKASCSPEANDKVKSRSSRNNTRTRRKDDVIETDGIFVCSLCSELIEAAQIETYTGATLIVCPAPILAQWYSEITRHTRPDSLKTYIYEGARNMDSSTHLKINMNKLISADIVLTTYDVLKEDLSHDSDRHDGDRRFLRFQKRYPVIPTLLTRINWWRLCLDEAQMVECNQASVTEMAMRLHAQHRWCITGTPIQRKFDDIYGLLRFLRASPFDVYRWWAEVIRDPYERRDAVAMAFVHNYFKNIMWRSSKVHVADELQLPPQDQCLSWLTFSSIEEHFYQKQHETCVSFAHDVINKLKNDLKKKESATDVNTSLRGFLSQNQVAKLLGPLLKLRQACCHPQVGSSGLCSLHENPLTMEEILEVLISKTKIEGEEALRKIVSSLNGLAAIAILEEDEKRAILLYKEALALADENSDDFRLDPLLNLHIHHNLAELVENSNDFSQTCITKEAHDLETKKRKATDICMFGKFYVKRAKTEKEIKETTEKASLEQHHGLNKSASCDLSPSIDGKKSEDDEGFCNSSAFDNSKEQKECDVPSQISSRCYASSCLRKTSEEIKTKYLSAFSSKVSLAQQDFKTLNMEVSNIYKELETQKTVWWLDALNTINQNKESSEELIKRIDQSVSRTASKASSRFKSITTLIYRIKNGLDSLQNSRQALIDRIIEIDQTMENPKDEDVLRLRYCTNCYDGDGSLCIHCELDKLFGVYEARLSLVRNANSGSMIQSVEDALYLRQRNIDLNYFFRNTKSSTEHGSEDDSFRERQAKESIQILKYPSELEMILKVIKTYSKTILSKLGTENSRKHMLLFESMRKEYSHARCLSKAQAHLLRAHDEIKMATTRLCLKETDDEPVAINVLSREELVPSSLQLSSEKFLSLSSLQRIKGQLRYLKGMAVSNQTASHQQVPLSKTQDIAKVSNLSLSTDGNNYRKDYEPCPICHEKLPDQKMVFGCGHVVCCKCCLQLTEHAVTHSGKGQKKWIMCPTCRQRTDFENIAYVNEKHNLDSDFQSSNNAFVSKEASEDSIAVQGSYGTKIEAITKRILWIILNDPDAKVLVFSSWNDVLDLLGHALATNNITYVRMKGGRKAQIAIAQFKGEENTQGVESKKPMTRSKPAQVLMMLIQHGANGLNLLEAQHVILIEPLLNPGAEAQAISRVHRVGQDKKTFIHRFMVKNTIEESIYKLNVGRSVTSLVNARVTKGQDRPALTIEDVEALFPLTRPSEVSEYVSSQADSLRNLPPSVAAGLAAQRRLMEVQDN